MTEGRKNRIEGGDTRWPSLPARLRSGSMEDVKIHYFFPKYTVFHVFMFSQYIDKLIIKLIHTSAINKRNITPSLTLLPPRGEV
jgi:hypothetical protein